MLYLKRSLKGEALKVIDALPVCNANYEVAWAALNKRYANEYILKKRYVNAMLLWPQMKTGNNASIHGLIECFERNLEILQHLGESTDQWGVLLVQIIISKLDSSTQQKWERHVEENNGNSVCDLLNFLRAQTRIMDAVAVDKPTAAGKIVSERRVASNVAAEAKCVKCGGSHLIDNCDTFRALTVGQRREIVAGKKLCSSCLKPGHFQARCWSRVRCTICNRKHHLLLHSEDNVAVRAIPLEDSPSPSAAVNTSAEEGYGTVFLATAIVNVRSSGGKWLPAKALIDSGSQVSLMTKGLAAKLCLPYTQATTILSVVGEAKVSLQTSVTTKIRSRDGKYQESMQFLVLPKITEYNPVSGAKISRQQLPRNFVLADPSFDEKVDIDLLLGSEFYADFLKPDSSGKLRANFGTALPAFINTVFGWVAVGQVHSRKLQAKASHHYITCGTCVRLEDLIERFWNIEEVHQTPLLTQEQNDCEAHFMQHHYRDGEGRYVVKLPLKAEVRNQLGQSETTARKRFLQLERRFNRDQSLKQQYSAVVDDYIQKGFLVRVDNTPSCKDVCNSYYLPHHPVIKTSSASTKIRPVFDGSMQTDSGKSLNDLLMTGPVIQDTLLSLLIRFRMRAVVLVADIKQMYLQVKVHPDCTPFQRILWRSSPDQALECYELQRVTFGLASSSFLAVRVLHQLANDDGDKFPLAKQALKEDFYVDDYIGGASTEEEASRLQAELTMLLKCGGFHITKWNCNKADVLHNVPVEDRATAKVKRFEAPEEPVKTLGIAWLTESDQLYIDSAIGISNDNWTRRKVYSLVARIYDPLGLVAPVTAWAKISMQALWLATSSWDEDIPSQMQERWCAFQSQVPLLKEVRFQRHALVANPIGIQLHCFSDASEAAYGTCIYLRSIDSSGTITVELLAAKSRIAPLKRISLARLELCAALLAARLQKIVRQALRIQEVDIFMWTDATIVLHWIRAPSYSWATFVANRVSEIQDLTKGYKWMHVKGSDNPADIVSRGAMPNEMLASKLWFHGPTWLQQPESLWQPNSVMDPLEESILEKRKRSVVVATNAESHNWCDRFSSFERLLRVTAYCLRFIRRCQRSPECYSGRILLGELNKVKSFLIKREQRVHFAPEIKELSAGKLVGPRSSLKTLGVFMDQSGLLRVGGRCSRMLSTYEAKHPVVLPRKTHLSRLIAETYHRMALHGGPTATLSMLRRELWVLQGRTLVNSVCRSCPVCFRMNPKAVQQPPGQLPIERVTQARPFSTTGVDFCGPIYLKPVHRRAAAEKAYIAIFVCFAVKAVHIELVESLSTPAFLAAFRRFVSRRGKPKIVYSDNGLNFQGASNRLKELYEMLRSESAQNEIYRCAATMDMEWRFIPPLAPNFGGLWEAAVKVAKRTLMKVIGTRQLTCGEMTTVLAQIEAQLNSRPLTPLSEDSTEIDVLTPGHFLIGAPLSAIPDPDVSEVATNRLKRFELLQQVVQHHWNRWRREYLSELHNANQRGKQRVLIQEGNMVLLKDDSKMPLQWPLGRIVKTYAGQDGIVRVVDIKTAGGTYKRPVNRICLLPAE